MRTIVYGVAGEGLGHSVRALSVIPGLLKSGHKLVLLVGGRSKEILQAEYYGHPHVSFKEIPVPLFDYDSKGNLKPISSIKKFIFNWKKRKQASKNLLSDLENVDLFISDYEPITSWTAKKLKKPLITLNSQNFYYHTKAIGLISPRHWLNFWFIRWSAQYFGIRRKLSIVSHYEQDCFNRDLNSLKVVGPMIRSELKNKKRYIGNFILVYAHPSVEHLILPAVINSKQSVTIYGLGKRKTVKSKRPIFFKEINTEKFTQDLLTCSKVITTAGTTLTSECMYLNIPMLVIPIPGQIEQGFNADLLEKKNVPVARNKKDIWKIVSFIRNEQSVEYLNIEDGSEKAVEIINDFLANSID